MNLYGTCGMCGEPLPPPNCAAHVCKVAGLVPRQ